MKNGLLIIIFFIACFISGCGKKYFCPSCLSFNVQYLDSANTPINEYDSLPFTMIKNAETDTILFSQSPARGNPFELFIYPVTEQSTFVFSYLNKPNDTIIFQHHYDVEYGKKCREHYFKNKSYALAKCTFPKYDILTNTENNLCPPNIQIQF